MRTSQTPDHSLFRWVLILLVTLVFPFPGGGVIPRAAADDDRERERSERELLKRINDRRYLPARHGLKSLKVRFRVHLEGKGEKFDRIRSRFRAIRYLFYWKAPNRRVIKLSGAAERAEQIRNLKAKRRFLEHVQFFQKQLREFGTFFLVPQPFRDRRGTRVERTDGGIELRIRKGPLTRTRIFDSSHRLNEIHDRYELRGGGTRSYRYEVQRRTVQGEDLITEISGSKLFSNTPRKVSETYRAKYQTVSLDGSGTVLLPASISLNSTTNEKGKERILKFRYLAEDVEANPEIPPGVFSTASGGRAGGKGKTD